MDDLWRFKQLFSGIRIFDMFRPEIKVSTAYDRLVFVVDMCLRYHIRPDMTTCFKNCLKRFVWQIDI